MGTKPKSVDAATAARMFEGGAHMLDVRKADAWSAGHVEGSDRVDPGAVDSHHVGRADSIITVCRNGSRSRRAARKLAKEGYRVYHLAGGLRAWKAAGLPLVTSNGGRPSV